MYMILNITAIEDMATLGQFTQLKAFLSVLESKINEGQQITIVVESVNEPPTFLKSLLTIADFNLWSEHFKKLMK